jgi:hypothetical protein
MVLILIAFLLILLLFRKPISERITRGDPVEMSAGTKGFKILLGSKETGTEQPDVAERSAQLTKSFRDFRLTYLVPSPEPDRFYTMPLPTKSPITYYNYVYAPCGAIYIRGIPFVLPLVANDKGEILGHHTIDIAPREMNEPTIVEIPTDISNVIKLYFLLSAGYGWVSRHGVQFAGRRIGWIELEFSDKSSQRVELVLGENIREWAFGNSPDLVVDVDYTKTQPAWVSIENQHRLDFMPVSIDNEPKHLARIRICAKFEIDPHKEMQFPAIIISAITCERRTGV